VSPKARRFFQGGHLDYIVKNCQLLLERRSCLLRCVDKTRRRNNKRFDNMENMKDQLKKYINIHMIMQLENKTTSNSCCSYYKMMMMMIRTLGITLH
jgi:hypothetical protein